MAELPDHSGSSRAGQRRTRHPPDPHSTAQEDARRVFKTLHHSALQEYTHTRQHQEPPGSLSRQFLGPLDSVQDDQAPGHQRERDFNSSPTFLGGNTPATLG